MIHVFIGTKAQYVKTAPVLQVLDKQNIAYNLIDSGQHAGLSESYRTFFALKKPDVSLSDSGKDIASLSSFLVWFSAFLLKILINPGYIRTHVFAGQQGICLIHGDTPTTLLSLFAAKRAGIQVAHLESGLRSFNWLNPFPEEIIRMIVMRFSDFLFAPSPWSYNNLKKLKPKGCCIELCGNTNIDALRYAATQQVTLPQSINTDTPFGLVTIHRAETVLSRARLKQIINLIRDVSTRCPLIFCMHKPTEKYLHKYNLYSSLSDLKNIQICALLSYPGFITLLKKSLFIVTDGGSIQEESFYLNKPCLLMRTHTERDEGLGKNVYISEFKNEKIEHFFTHLDQFTLSGYTDSACSPALEIVTYLKQLRAFAEHSCKSGR